MSAKAIAPLSMETATECSADSAAEPRGNVPQPSTAPPEETPHAGEEKLFTELVAIANTWDPWGDPRNKT